MNKPRRSKARSKPRSGNGAKRRGGAAGASQYQFHLYVAGQTLHSQNAATHLRDIFESRLLGRYQLTILDVLERPDVAERERILATPTLVRVKPGPERRLIGDMSQRAAVLQALELPAPSEEHG